MPKATINGTDLFYVEEGDGPPCIVVHGGLGFDHTVYRSTMAPLHDLVRAIYVDLRGNGRSGRPPVETITIPQLASDIDAFRVHLGLERVALLGHSYGGFVALEYATTYPDKVSQLSLVDTSPGVFEPTSAELAERPSDDEVPVEVEAALRELFSRMPETNDEMAEAFPRIAPSYFRGPVPASFSAVMRNVVYDAGAMARGFEVLAGWTVADKLDRITAPTFVACGRYDLHTTPECSVRLASAIADAELVWFEGSRHFPWIEEADPFFVALGDWLARH